MKKIVAILTIIITISTLNINVNAAANGTWIESNNNWWYSYADGSYATSEYIDGYWIGSDGWYDPAWNGSWKCNSTGWWFQSGSWYPTSQWLKINHEWYYFKSSGYMACNEWVGNYYIQSDGTMATDMWIGDYYVGSDGAWVPGKKKETVTTYTTETTTVHHDGSYRCRGCGATFTTAEAAGAHCDNGSDTCYYSGYTGTPGWDETVTTQVPHTETVTVVDQAAYDETVVDTPAWDETVEVQVPHTRTVCSECGATK